MIAVRKPIEHQRLGRPGWIFIPLALALIGALCVWIGSAIANAAPATLPSISDGANIADLSDRHGSRIVVDFCNQNKQMKMETSTPTPGIVVLWQIYATAPGIGKIEGMAYAAEPGPITVYGDSFASSRGGVYAAVLYQDGLPTALLGYGSPLDPEAEQFPSLQNLGVKICD